MSRQKLIFEKIKQPIFFGNHTRVGDDPMDWFIWNTQNTSQYQPCPICGNQAFFLYHYNKSQDKYCCSSCYRNKKK